MTFPKHLRAILHTQQDMSVCRLLRSPHNDVNRQSQVSAKYHHIWATPGTLMKCTTIAEHKIGQIGLIQISPISFYICSQHLSNCSVKPLSCHRTEGDRGNSFSCQSLGDGTSPETNYFQSQDLGQNG